VAELVRNYPIRSTNVIAHIRKATRGVVGLENTHPFMRELWGRYWIFAHNGTLEGFEPSLGGRFRPVGTTDSELAFCCILEAMREAFPGGMPEITALANLLRQLSRDVSRHGKFNYLLSNGDLLFAHCANRLSYNISKSPFDRAFVGQGCSGGLWPTPDDRVAVIATAPLTDNEPWRHSERRAGSLSGRSTRRHPCLLVDSPSLEARTYPQQIQWSTA
jgi:glutamine amidotransferase